MVLQYDAELRRCRHFIGILLCSTNVMPSKSVVGRPDTTRTQQRFPKLFKSLLFTMPSLLEMVFFTLEVYHAPRTSLLFEGWILDLDNLHFTKLRCNVHTFLG